MLPKGHVEGRVVERLGILGYFCQKTVSPIPFPPLEINESPDLFTGLNGHVPGKTLESIL
jgi:hypothetical protein